MTTAAMPNRTARKSGVGTWATRSWIRKNVEPHTVVTPSRSSVASPWWLIPCARRRSVPGLLDNDEGDGGALGLLAVSRRVLAADGSKDAAHEALDLHLEAGLLQDLLRFVL